MIEWTVTSSVLILVVLALRSLLMGRISLRLQYGLWVLVLLRLLVPVSLGATAVSVLNITDSARLPDPVVGYVGGHTIQSSISEPDPSLSQEEWQAQYEQNQAQWQTELDDDRAENGTAISLGTVFLGLWAAVAVAVGLWLLWVNIRFARALRRSRVPLAVEGCPRPVYVTGAVQTPCLFGLLRPSIYVTEEAAADETVLRHSLAHELTHYRHRDHIWAALRGLCLALHWYNPLVWLAAALSRRDGELCCDEATVKRLGEGERAAYGRTLLAVTCQGRANPMLTATSMTGSGKGIRERIRLLARQPKTAAYTMVAVMLIAVIAVGCTFTGAERDGGEEAPVFSRTKEIVSVTLEGRQSETEVGPEYLEEMITWLHSFARGDALAEDEVLEPGAESYSIAVVYADGSTQRSGVDVTEWEGVRYRVVREELPACWHELWDGQGVTALTAADLDRDGEEETIGVVQVDPQLWQLVVTKADGTELFREGAATSHSGWKSFFLCRDSQKGDCLLRYTPTTYTGLSHYTYTLFTLEGGEETVAAQGSLDFESDRVREQTEELMAFADEVNSLLRHSSLLLSTLEGELRIGPAGWGEYLEHLDSLEGFLTKIELEEYRTTFWPEIMEGEEVIGVNPASAFFTSYYERPEELNFEEFLRYLPDDGLVSDAPPEDPEFQALTRQPGWPFEEGSLIPTPIHRYSRQSVDAVLEQYAGISTRDLSGAGMDEVLYLEEYDAWYNFTSDYGPGIFIPVYGLREGSVVTLWELPSGNGAPGDVLTLKETGNGFRILSHLPGE